MDVVDYSETGLWGELPKRIVDVLTDTDAAGYTSLEQLRVAIGYWVNEERLKIEEDRQTDIEAGKEVGEKPTVSIEDYFISTGLYDPEDIEFSILSLEDIRQIQDEMLRSGSQINRLILDIVKVLRNLLGAFACSLS